MSDQLMNIKFVEEVEKHDILYNYNLPRYSRKDLTEKAWHGVAAKVNMTGMYHSIDVMFVIKNLTL